MILPNWLKVTWWAVLLAALTALLWPRRSAFLAGTGTALDAIAFVIWICLMLVPIFSEIKIFGFEFKQKIEELKKHIDQQVMSLRSDIQTSVELRTQINPQINIMQPPPDTQLPKIAENVKLILHNYTVSNIGAVGAPIDNTADVAHTDPDIVYLFGVRRAIEVELRRLCIDRLGDEGPCKTAAGMQLLHRLSKFEIFNSELIRVIQQVYRVCSPAIHGEIPTPEQVRFVREVAPELIATLRSLR